MPEGDTDKFRRTPELPLGLAKPVSYPTKPFIRETGDEAYQFRFPNVAYNDGSRPHDLPDGLQTDGTEPRHFGDVQEAKE